MTRILITALSLFVAAPLFAAEPPKLKILFLGDTAGHKPKERFDILSPVFAKRNIALTYTDKLDDLNLDNLNKFDGLMIYANQTPGKPEQVKAILEYVAAGKGFIPLHCASYCFNTNKDFIDLVGAQFRSHTTGTFRVKDTAPDHAIMKGYGGFESFDETYVHHKHNEKDRTVLETRAEGKLEEPWTWVRTQGKGRVFYTAWGHDSRTWNNPGFQNLVERGTRWACNQDPALAGDFQEKETAKTFTIPKMKPITGDTKDFEYVEAKLPFYAPPRGAGIQGDAPTKMQKPLSPEKSMTHYTMPEGFELKLFASDEMFQGGKPLCMTWDERGRLWVAVTTDYPNEMQKAGEGRDKILILEDTDGDGKADKITTFAEKLSIPTSLLCVHGGVLVHQAPHTLFLKDTKGEGKADVRQILFSGWGTRDTHAGPSNLRYGFDNWIYGAVGYSGFAGEVAGERFNFKQGFYRFKLESTPKGALDVKKLEFLRSTSNNTWGFCFNENGEMFGSTANGCALVHLPIPNRYYEKVKGLTPTVLPQINDNNRMYPVTDRVRQVDWHGGFTAAANCSIYTARNYPPEYWNRTAFVSEPTGHLTATFELTPSGTTYTAKNSWNLVASRDEWAAPIDAQVGPDGNVWILDWYNYIVQHNPTPRGFNTGKGAAYETDLRDKKHGRVYRLVYTKAKPEKTPDLSKATPAELVKALGHDNMFWRQTAQRILVERGNTDVVAGLNVIIGDYEKNPLGTVHALWVSSGLGTNKSLEKIDLERSMKLAKNGSAVVMRALVESSRDHNAMGAFTNEILKSKDPSARLAAVLALVDLELRVPDFGHNVITALQNDALYQDRNTQLALRIYSTTHSATVVFKVAEDDAKLSNSALEIVKQSATTFAATGGGIILPHLLLKLAEMKENSTREAILLGLAAGWPTSQKPKLSEDGEKAFAKLLTTATPTTRGKLLKLGATWGLPNLDAQLAEIVKASLATALDPKAADAARLDAAKQVLEFQTDDATAAKLLDTLTEKSSAAYALGLLELLSGSPSKTLGPVLVAKLPILPPTARPNALRSILARPEPTKAFLDAVEKGTLRFDMLALDQKASLAAHPDKAIAERAKKLLTHGGGLPDADRQKVIDEFANILKEKGDVANGKKLFTTHCAKCHKHGGEGEQIGPDLTGFAVHPKEEILIAVLDPSRSVEGNFKAYTASMVDGRVINGLLSSESKTSVELLDAENKRHALQRDDIDKLKESVKSLMPEGFEKQMKAAELGDLLEFLTQKGKYVPIPLDKVATVVSTKDMFFGADGTQERLIFKDWKAKEFDGVPFSLVDPQGEKTKNVILFNGPQGTIPPTMPKSVTLPCNTPAKAIHLLSGIGGWSATTPNPRGTVSLIVRLNYADGKTEDHELKDGVHFADYIRKVDVPGSKFAFAARNQQVRYLSVTPKRNESIKTIDLVKGPDRTAPIVVAVTIETP